MLEQYEFEGEIFNVHPSQKKDFLKKYPNAQLKLTLSYSSRRRFDDSATSHNSSRLNESIP